VPTTEAKTFANEKNLLFFEISAKEGVNITETFNEVAKKLTGTVSNPIVKSTITNQGFSLDP
jgi:Ras-related protein Rab-5C